MAEAAFAVKNLVEELASADDWRVRRGAALELARQPGPGAFAALNRALNDRDHDVRHAAVLALGELGDPRAVEVLCRPVVLEDSVTEIRWAAVTALGQLGDLSLATPLARALDDPEWVVRNQALLVMEELIRRIPETIDGEQIKSLIRLLAIPDMEVRSLVVDALARRSTRGLDEMSAAINGRSAAVRAGVAEALGLSQDPRAVAPLIAAINDPVAAVRTAAASGLGRLADERAVEPLIEVLGDSDALASQATIDALVAIGEPAVGPMCNALARATAKIHRRNLIKALGEMGDKRAVIPLLNNLSSSYYVVRCATVSALSSYGELVVQNLISMVRTSEVPIAALVREVQEQEDKRLRLRAVRALGEIKNAAALKTLRELLSEGDRDLTATTQEAMSKIGLAAWARHGAVAALGNIGDSRAVPALIQALSDHSEHVRGEAAGALARIGDAGTISSLIATLLNDDVAAVRRQAGAALRVLGAQNRRVARAFRQALGDDSWEVRSEAARALGRIDDPESIEPLLAALQDSSYTVLTCAENALANLGRLALPALFAAAGGPDSPRRQPALSALAEILGKQHREAVADLLTCPTDDRARRSRELLAASS